MRGDRATSCLTGQIVSVALKRAPHHATRTPAKAGVQLRAARREPERSPPGPRPSPGYACSHTVVRLQAAAGSPQVRLVRKGHLAPSSASETLEPAGRPTAPATPDRASEKAGAQGSHKLPAVILRSPWIPACAGCKVRGRLRTCRAKAPAAAANLPNPDRRARPKPRQYPGEGRGPAGKPRDSSPPARLTSQGTTGHPRPSPSRHSKCRKVPGGRTGTRECIGPPVEARDRAVRLQ
jgi:hypothetical protein